MLLGRFVSVGAGATAVHYLVLTLLVEGCGEVTVLTHAKRGRSRLEPL